MNLFTNQNNFLIIGKKGSGKTALAWTFAHKIRAESNRNIFFYKFPHSFLLNELPFKVTNLTKLEQLASVKNGVVLVDEAHRHFDSPEKMINRHLRDILSVSRQNNTDFIFIAHNGYFVARSLFSFIDVRIIKEVGASHWELDRSYLKKLYQHVLVAGVENYFIDCDTMQEYQSFSLPSWFSDTLSSAYSYSANRTILETAEKSADETAEKSADETAEKSAVHTEVMLFGLPTKNETERGLMIHDKSKDKRT